MNKTFNLLPAYIAIIAANLLPVYGVIIGKLLFFQVLYLYWFESLLLIFFDWIRIATAQGRVMEYSYGRQIKDIVFQRDYDRDLTFRGRLRLIFSTTIIRILILLFYLLFIVVFVGFQISGRSGRHTVFATMIFQNPFFNTAVIFFLINMTVQLIGGFFISGRYKVMAPANYTDVFTGRTILMHVMIVGSAVMHQFLFDGKSYVALGEVLYVGIFMLARTLIDLNHLRKQHEKEPVPMPMI